MTIIPTTLNATGIATVEAELASHNLNWNVEATVDDICSRPGFDGVLTNGSYDYELRGVRWPSGHQATIFITPDMVVTEELPDDE